MTSEPKPTRICKMCQKPFKMNGKSLTCSKKCSADLREFNKHPTTGTHKAECVHCGETFTKVNAAKTCSEDCSVAHQKASRKNFPSEKNRIHTTKHYPTKEGDLRTCMGCGETFYGKGNVNTCSKDCAKARDSSPEALARRAERYAETIRQKDAGTFVPKRTSYGRRKKSILTSGKRAMAYPFDPSEEGLLAYRQLPEQIVESPQQQPRKHDHQADVLDDQLHAENGSRERFSITPASVNDRRNPDMVGTIERHELIVKACIECGKSFTPKLVRVRICSIECAKLRDLRLMAVRAGKDFVVINGKGRRGVTKPCEVCGNNFVAPYKQVTCCSGECHSKLKLVRLLRQPEDEMKFLRQVLPKKRRRRSLEEWD